MDVVFELLRNQSNQDGIWGVKTPINPNASLNPPSAFHAPLPLHPSVLFTPLPPISTALSNSRTISTSSPVPIPGHLNPNLLNQPTPLPPSYFTSPSSSAAPLQSPHLTPPTALSLSNPFRFSSFIQEKIQVFTQKYHENLKTDPNFNLISSPLLNEGESLLRIHRVDISLFPREIRKILELKHCQVLLEQGHLKKAFKLCTKIEQQYAINFNPATFTNINSQSLEDTFQFYVFHEVFLFEFIEKTKTSSEINLEHLIINFNFLKFAPQHRKKFYEILNFDVLASLLLGGYPVEGFPSSKVPRIVYTAARKVITTWPFISSDEKKVFKHWFPIWLTQALKDQEHQKKESLFLFSNNSDLLSDAELEDIAAIHTFILRHNS